ncbi:hypothetical protein CHK_0073 [Christensenella hongkongensis]|uniref:Uncharacterized protein n=1 Tax=Christensenella hongkongensis TaxID=270498 RepID=A0A0M2NIP8_9FIRM|nr:hypothetical protein CHK_0073 [Christensenella hongkongensis]
MLHSTAFSRNRTFHIRFIGNCLPGRQRCSRARPYRKQHPYAGNECQQPSSSPPFHGQPP